MLKRIQDAREYYQDLQISANALVENKRQLTAQLVEARSSVEIYNKAMMFLQRVSTVSREEARTRIEEVVTSALQYVYGEAYSFSILLKPTKGRPEADYLLVNKTSGKEMIFNPMLSNGGGITDLLSVALKFALLQLLGYDGIMWLDEPFKQISKEYVPAAGKLLSYMGETSGRQIIYITHNEDLVNVCNKVFTVKNVSGYSTVLDVKKA